MTGRQATRRGGAGRQSARWGQPWNSGPIDLRTGGQIGRHPGRSRCKARGNGLSRQSKEGWRHGSTRQWRLPAAGGGGGAHFLGRMLFCCSRFLVSEDFLSHNHPTAGTTGSSVGSTSSCACGCGTARRGAAGLRAGCLHCAVCGLGAEIRNAAAWHAGMAAIAREAPLGWAPRCGARRDTVA